VIDTAVNSTVVSTCTRATPVVIVSAVSGLANAKRERIPVSVPTIGRVRVLTVVMERVVKITVVSSWAGTSGGAAAVPSGCDLGVGSAVVSIVGLGEITGTKGSMISVSRGKRGNE